MERIKIYNKEHLKQKLSEQMNTTVIRVLYKNIINNTFEYFRNS